MNADDYTDFDLISNNGVLISDTFESWRKKSNGVIVESVQLGNRLNVISSQLWPNGQIGDAPTYVDLLSQQNIQGQKTFSDGVWWNPTLRVGLAGFHYTRATHVLNVTAPLRTDQLINSGNSINLRNIEYLLPQVPASGTKHSLLISSPTGNSLSWKSINDLRVGNTLLTDIQGRLYVGEITANELATNSVTSIKIGDSQVISTKIAAGAINASHIAAGVVNTSHIAIDAITTPSIGNEQVSSGKIAPGAINSSHINVSGLASAAISSGAITPDKLSGNQGGASPIYGARAWVSFDGFAGSTVGAEFRCNIIGSGNVSKVVRIGTGLYDVYFTTPMNSANYAAMVSATGGASSDSLVLASTADDNRPRTASVVSVATAQVRGDTSSGELRNSTKVGLVVFQ